jgi:uncharacterized protein HemY
VNRSTRNDEASLDVLQGELALAQGGWQQAIPLLEVSVRLDPDAGGVEPLARAYAAGSRWADAVRVYADLAGQTSRGNEMQESLQLARYELGTLYERTGEPARARTCYQQFLAQWTSADEDLPVLLQVKRRLQALR